MYVCPREARVGVGGYEPIISSDETIILSTLLLKIINKNKTKTKIKIGKEQKKTTMTLRPKGENYKTVLGALDTDTAAAAATKQGVRATTPGEFCCTTQDANNEYDSSSRNNKTMSKIVNN
jgi:hypothetical protein